MCLKEMNNNPEILLAWLALVLDFEGEGALQRIGRDSFDGTFDTVILAQLLKRKPAAFAVALRLARIVKSSQAIEAVIETLASSLHDSGIKQSVLATLPIEALPDLRWLAEETGQPDLSAALALVHGDQNQGE